MDPERLLFPPEDTVAAGGYGIIKRAFLFDRGQAVSSDLVDGPGVEVVAVKELTFTRDAYLSHAKKVSRTRWGWCIIVTVFSQLIGSDLHEKQ